MKIWKRNFNLDALNAMGAGTINEVIGFKFTEIGDDYLIAEMPVDSRTKQPFGILHGGVSVVMAETLGSVASVLCLPIDANKTAVGLEVNANHLKAVRKGFVHGKVTPIRVGSKIHVWQIEIKDDKGNLTCTSRLTTMVINKG